MKRLRLALIPVLLASLAGVGGALPHASAGDSGRYVGAGTAVVRQNGEPAADEGTVVCDDGAGVGSGGVCLEFGDGDAIQVVDDAMGEKVAFQVCLDNNGDGVCTSPDRTDFCPDEIFFSHDDAGGFHNPVGPLPTGFAQGCAGGPWKGYVVFLCEGAHAVGTDVHTHAATSGTASVTYGGEGQGTFCGGGPQPSRKRYTVGSGARYTSGGTAVARQDGQPAVDDGSVVCNGGDNVGVGGFCTSFGAGDAMAVTDAAAGTDVAFQVCIDNSADGVCTSPDTSPECPDQVFFSHDDAGNFYNPLGPIPTGFLPGCGARTPWQGYVVFLCEGTHVAGTSAHAHAATTGTGRVTTGGGGRGTFCGGSHAAPSRKTYALNPVPFPPRDGCDARVAGDPTKQLGGQNVVNGAVRLTATSPDGAAITATCELRIDGEIVSTILGPATGTGAVAAAGQFQFTADPDATVEVCLNLAKDGESQVVCSTVSPATGAPQPVQDAADTVAALVAPAADRVATTVCLELVRLAPKVDALGQPAVVYIDPSSGDTYLNGTLVKDC